MKAVVNSCTGPMGYGRNPINTGRNKLITAIKGDTPNIDIVRILVDRS